MARGPVSGYQFPMPVTVTRATTPAQLAAVRTLILKLLDWSRVTYADRTDLVAMAFRQADWEGFCDTLGTAFVPPAGIVLLAEVDGVPAGCVCIRRLDDAACEMKRMYVDEAFQGRGVARAIAEASLQSARDMGYRVMKLDTGDRQVAAQKLYRSLGFRDIEPYWDCPPDVRPTMLFMERAL